MSKKQSSFCPSDAEIAEGAESPAESADDLTKTVKLRLKRREISVTFDLGEMTPRLRKRLSNLNAEAEQAEVESAMCEYLAVCVECWTLCDKQGNPVELTTEAIAGAAAYRDIVAIVSALNVAALPNVSEGAI